MAGVETLVILMASALIAAGQRPFFAGSRPIGYPELINRTTTTPSGLEDKFGDVTTQRLPIEAQGDRELVDRLSKLPLDKQPFWLINWQALEANREKPQTYPLKPSPFLEENFQNNNNNNPVVNSNTGFVNPNPGVVNTNTDFVNRNGGFVNSNAGFVNPNAGFVNTNSGFVSPNTGFVNRNSSLVNSNPGLPTSNLNSSFSNANPALTNNNFANVNPGVANANSNVANANPGIANTNPAFANNSFGNNNPGSTGNFNSGNQTQSPNLNDQVPNNANSNLGNRYGTETSTAGSSSPDIGASITNTAVHNHYNDKRPVISNEDKIIFVAHPGWFLHDIIHEHALGSFEESEFDDIEVKKL